jgi:hypothetical protein
MRYADHSLKWQDTVLFDKLESLHITYAHCFRPEGTGKVHLGMPAIGGSVDYKGGAVPEWIGEFLRDAARRDVICKLQHSGATELHAFVIVSFSGAPWPVESYLSGDLDHLPSQAPDLPLPVTGVWIVSATGRRGIYWDGNTWRLFDARGEGIDD